MAAFFFPRLLCLALLAFTARAKPKDHVDLLSSKTDNSIASNQVRPGLKIKYASPTNLAVPIASTRVLECEAAGNPPPLIYWLKNGKRIHQSEDSSDLEVSQGLGQGLALTRSRLWLDCVQPSDEALYTCVAENSFERRSSSTSLKVASLGDSLLPANSLAFCATKKAYGTPARINMWTKTRLELIGSDVRLFCRSQGFPKPSVTWLGPDGKILTSADKTNVLENGDLIIRDLSWSDMGGYQCVVSNEDGEDQSTTFVYPILPEKS